MRISLSADASPSSRQPTRSDSLSQSREGLGTSLQRRYSTEDADTLLKPFHALGRNRAFWHHTLAGLAVFGAHNRFEAYCLQRPVAEFAVAADSFHVKPVIRFLQ